MSNPTDIERVAAVCAEIRKFMPKATCDHPCEPRCEPLFQLPLTLIENLWACAACNAVYAKMPNGYMVRMLLLPLG